MCFFFVRLLEYLWKPRTREGTAFVFIKVTSCQELCPLLACVLSYLQSILRYKVLFVDACCPDILYSREQWYEDPWLFFETKRVRGQKRLGNSVPEDLKIVSLQCIGDRLTDLQKCLLRQDLVSEQDKQWTCNLTVLSLRVTIVGKEQQQQWVPFVLLTYICRCQ